LFEDFSHVKFYRLSLRASVELDAGLFDDGFHHVDDWVPKRLVTATGPNALARSATPELGDRTLRLWTRPPTRLTP